MGCDIHLWVEKCTGEDGYGEKTWEVIPKAHEPRPESKIWEEQRGEWYSGRNYDLFSILANVRNGSGFAGVKTGDGFEPILSADAEGGNAAYPYDRHGDRMTTERHCRGVPGDASDKYAAEVFRMGVDGHSHSYLTLAELNAYSWSSKSTKSGLVTANEFLRWKEKGGGQPCTWCGDVDGPRIRKVSQADILNLVSSGVIRQTTKDPNPFQGATASDGYEYHTRIEWTVDYKEAAGDFVTRTLPLMNDYAKAHGIESDDIRIVFFFDN